MLNAHCIHIVCGKSRICYCNNNNSSTTAAQHIEVDRFHPQYLCPCVCVCVYLHSGRECVAALLARYLDHEFADAALLIEWHGVAFHFHRQSVASHVPVALGRASEWAVNRFVKPLAQSQDLQFQQKQQQNKLNFKLSIKTMNNIGISNVQGLSESIGISADGVHFVLQLGMKLCIEGA